MNSFDFSSKLKIRKYLLELPLFLSNARGRQGEFKSKIEWKSPPALPSGVFPKSSEMRNIYARLLLKGGGTKGKCRRRRRRRRRRAKKNRSDADAGLLRNLF
jgi:hypothetical protein